MSDQGLIYTWVTFPGDTSVVVDITGSSVAFNLQFSPDDSPPSKSVPITDPSVPQALQQALVTPGLAILEGLPSFLEFAWTQFLPQLNSLIQTALNKNLGANNFAVTSNIPTSGRVRARAVPNGLLLIDLWIPGLRLNLDVTKGQLTGTFLITADAEFLLLIFLQTWPLIKVLDTAQLFNANLQPTGSTATKVSIGQLLWELGKNQQIATMGYASPSPDDVIQLYDAQINATLIAPPDVSPLASAFATLGQTAIPFGFPQCVASTDSAAGTLTLTLVHPVDPPPAAYDSQTMAGPIYALFGGPTLGTSQTQATPGGQLGVIGTDFPPSGQVGIAWTDTCSGELSSSDVLWGPSGQQQNPTHLSPTNLSYAPNGLQPGQQYTFQARNSDDFGLTTTQYSNQVTIQAIGTIDLLLSYQSNAPTVVVPIMPPGNPPPPPPPNVPPHPKTAVVGTAAAGPNGTFSLTITIPLDAVPNTTATLAAQVFGQIVASQPISIVGRVQALLVLVDPSTGTTGGTTVLPGYSVSVRGEGFTKSSQVWIYIDQAVGEGIQTAVVGNDGTFTATFTWPVTLNEGDHTLIAIGLSFPAVEASLTLTQELLPQ